MSFRRISATVAALAALLFALTACGGSQGRPSADELAEALKASEIPGFDTLGEMDLPDEAFTCIAEVLHESDVSDETLNAIVEGDAGGANDDDMSKLRAVQSDITTECADDIQ